MKTTITKDEKENLKELLSEARDYYKAIDDILEEIRSIMDSNDEDGIDWLYDAACDRGAVSKDLNFALKQMKVEVE